MTNAERRGPLTGLKVIEFAGLGPTPFCGMLLSDLGANIVRIDRPGGSDLVDASVPTHINFLGRGRRSIALDLKKREATEACLRLIAKADALIEGYRPGVMERLGLGPESCLEQNPRLVYGRMTGWGQTGPYATRAGHDLNYIALSGAVHAIGPADAPTPPLNLVGDFGGGALYLAFGLLAAVLHARETGQGEIIDCAMCDGAVSLMSSIYALKAAELWHDERCANTIDGGAHFYNTYRCADGQFIAVAALERKFYAILVERTGLMDHSLSGHADRTQWPALKSALATIFARRTRAEWLTIMADADACFSPVLNLSDALEDAHLRSRRVFDAVGGVVQPAPLPKLSHAPGAIQAPPPEIGEHSRTALSDWGFSPTEIDRLFDQGAAFDATARR